MQHGSAQEVERDCRHGEDDHAEPGVKLHDAGPAPCAMGPGFVIGSHAGKARVTLLDAPVGVGEELGRADARDPECREGEDDGSRRHSQIEAVADIGRGDAEAGPLQDEHAGHCEERHRGDQNCRDLFEAAVAAGEQQQHRGQGCECRPEVLVVRQEIRLPRFAQEARGLAILLEAPGNAMWAPARRLLPSRRSGPGWPASSRATASRATRRLRADRAGCRKPPGSSCRA